MDGIGFTQSFDWASGRMTGRTDLTDPSAKVEWWPLLDSDQRPSRCKRDALTN